MEALSQKKKIGIIAGAILLLTVVTLVGTGRMSLTWLSSSAITSPTYVCSEQNQARNLAQYNQIPNNIINANNKISIISGEIKVLQDKINAHNTTIAQKQAQITTRPAEIARLNGLIAPLTTFINTKCSKPTGSMVRTCNDKKKEKLKYENEITKLNNLENDITKLQNEIGTPENSKTLKWKIQLKENQIGIWQGKITGYELSKKQYERCALELKTKPTVFSGAMSGEIKLISGEIQPGTEKLVSGEVMFFTGTVIAPHISGEVTMSGEVGQSPILTVVANKMEFSVKPTPENNFNIKDWFLEFDQYARTACTSKQVSSNPVEIKVTCNLPAKNTPPIIISAGTVGNFKLIGKLGSIAMPLAVETNFISLQYNWSRTDIDNQTAPTKLRYDKPIVSDVFFRYASWTCYNGEKQNEGGASSCKPQTLWKQYAETFCQNKCSPETGKCGVNSYSNSEQCIDAPSGCGNGIKEGAEQCDDGNTNNGDGCSQECTLEWAYPWYMMKTDRQEYGNGGTILLEISSMTNAKWFVDLYIQPYNWYGSESGVLIQKNIEINPKTTYKIAIPNYPNIFDETDNYLLVISAAGQARKPQNVNSLHIKVSVPTSIICGNGIKEGAEQCDDGNTANGDGCDSLCKSEVVNGCNDSDGGENIFKYGEAVIWEQKVQDQCNLKVFNGYNDQYNLVKSCTGSNCVVLEAICDQYSTNDGLAEYARSKIVSCPNGCNDGACKPADPVAEVCEDLAVTPSMTQGGGNVSYTCQWNTDILCVLDPAFCKPKTYSVILKDPTGTVIKTITTETGTFILPATPLGTYSVECFVNNQTTTTDACKKPITNQASIGPKLSGFDVTFPLEVTVNKPFDMKVRAVDAAGTTVPQYEGKVLFKIMDRPENDYIMPKIPGSTSGEFAYQFSLADQGSHQFTEWFTFKKAGIYSVIVLDSATQNNPVSVYRSFWITAKEPAISCTGTLPANALILANVGNTSRVWTHDGSPNGPYQNCSFQCPAWTTYQNGLCTVPATSLNITYSGGAVAQNIAAKSTDTEGSKSNFQFVSTGGTSTITELKFTVLGNNTVANIKLGNTSAPVINGTALLTGLNITVPNNSTGIVLGAVLTYNDVGTFGTTSGTTSQLILSGVKFSNGSTTNTLSPNLSAPTMTLVGSKPTITVSQPNSILTVGSIEAIDVTITADVKWDIKINSLPIIISASNASFNTTANTLSVRDSGNTPISSQSTVFQPTTSGWSLSIVSFPNGYIIPAGTSQKFRIYAQVSSVTGIWTTGSSLSTSLYTNWFSWTDIAGGATLAQTSTNNIVGYPYLVYSVVKN